MGLIGSAREGFTTGKSGKRSRTAEKPRATRRREGAVMSGVALALFSPGCEGVGRVRDRGGVDSSAGPISGRSELC